MLMAGGAFACAQQPEKKDASAATEATAPATESPATDEQEKSESGDAEKTDSTAGESAKEENKVRVQAQVRATPPPHRKLRIPLSKLAG